eukprot:TRINITY_DN5462_c1_g7_i1.p1 TRINITY_DN5462_c1_g7~~TRINITY_DN5462_c1_g7_i1.p1  ORF type:complete len:195 (+),score=37.26 TRINITY_DN5462_c1_g7_i1:68-586(+)
MALYGWALDHGIGIAHDVVHGRKFLQQSKHILAQFQRLMFGIGMKQDRGAAYRLLATKCDTSDPHVQFLLGYCSWHGLGRMQDDERAIAYFQRARNHLKALHCLGITFECGEGVDPDYSRAAHYYQQAAEQGYDEAQSELASMYENGKGVAKDMQQAQYWKQMATEGCFLSE